MVWRGLDELTAKLAQAEERAERWERLYLALQEQTAREREAHRQELREAHILASQAQETANRLASRNNPLKRLFAGKKKDTENGAYS